MLGIPGTFKPIDTREIARRDAKKRSSPSALRKVEIAEETTMSPFTFPRSAMRYATFAAASDLMGESTREPRKQTTPTPRLRERASIPRQTAIW